MVFELKGERLEDGNITYGPHSFPGGPIIRIRTVHLPLAAGIAHRAILETLQAAFDDKDPDSVVSQVSERFGLDGDVPVDLDFISYGKVQLVYVATLADTVKLTTLINQPQIPKEYVKDEFENLQRLVEMDPRFVAEPYVYFSKGRHGLYVSEYFDKGMGVYCSVDVPWCVCKYEPGYHHEYFSPEAQPVVKSSMIALLVNYYDEENHRGIGKTRIRGDDFILTQDYREYDPESILPNMRLIAARGFVDGSLDEYIGMLRREFVFGIDELDHRRESEGLLINHESVYPLSEREIETGIELGMSLREGHV